ncbi:MAG: rRNA maturation RNase YbeY [Marinovum sp.]|nr:rRNA maturation RNase YbeY [Marinovum sp.]
MLIDTLVEDPQWEALDIGGLAERAVAVTLDHLSVALSGCEVAILACNDARISTLNEEFRGKPTATNVLSWPSENLTSEEDGGAPLPPEDPMLGDIAIAYETCVQEANEAGKPLDAHVRHLIVHATLHLLGYDHVRDADAARMERLESAIVMSAFADPDPYSAA